MRACRILLPALAIFLIPSAASALVVGDRVQATSALNVRSGASVSGTLLGAVPLGALGTIIGGPTVNTHTWWNITWDKGLFGWSVQAYLRSSSQQSSAQQIQIPGKITPKLRNSSCPAVSLPTGKSCKGTWKEVKGTNGCTSSWKCQ